MPDRGARGVSFAPFYGLERDALRTGLLPVSYQPRVAFTTLTTSSITGTSISTPTTVASAAPDSKPNRLIAAATASSKKLLAPISADGQAIACCSPSLRFEPVGERRIEQYLDQDRHREERDHQRLLEDRFALEREQQDERCQ